ncbi:hypothetical protein ACQY0O_007253 [Thecaphora frezii]
MSSHRAKAGASTGSSSKQAHAHTAGIVQALHQEALARAAAFTLPKLSAQHSETFLKLAAISAVPEVSSSAVAPSIRHRRTLWGDEVPNVTHSHQPNLRLAAQTARPAAKASNEVLPEWYDLHNGRCPRCRLPFVPGLNSVRPPPSSRLRRSKEGAETRAQEARICGLCNPRYSAVALSYPSSSSSRHGRKRGMNRRPRRRQSEDRPRRSSSK